MIGQKFGEYSPTRTYYGHGADKKRNESKGHEKKRSRRVADNEAMAKLRMLKTSLKNLTFLPGLFV